MQSSRSTRPAVVIDVPDRPIVGVGGIIWRQDQVLLIRRGQPPRQGEWSLPGGRQELGETVEAAVRREVLEETALHVGTLRFVDMVDLIERNGAGVVTRHFTLLDFTAEALDGQPHAGSDAIEAGWFRLEDLSTLGLWDATLAVIRRAARLRKS